MIGINDLERYTFVVKVDLYDKIDQEQIDDIGRQIETAMCNVDYAMGEKLLYKSRTEFLGNKPVKKK